MALFVTIATAVPELPDGVWIHYSGALRGAIDPCGCKIPMGGTARRMGEIDRMMKIASSDAHLVVDAGEWRDLGDPIDGNTRTAALLKALKTGHLAAVNVSLRDVMLNRTFLDSIAIADSIPFVSANLRIDSIMAPLFPAYRIARGKVMNKPYAVAFIGLTDPTYTRYSNRKIGLVALDWTLILRDVMDELKKEKVNAIVLLTDAAPSRLDTLMGKVAVQFIVTTNPECQWNRITKTDHGYMIAPMTMGKHWEAVKSMATGPDPWIANRTELSASVPESEAAHKIIEEYRARFIRKPVPAPAVPPQVIKSELSQPASAATPTPTPSGK